MSSASKRHQRTAQQSSSATSSEPTSQLEGLLENRRFQYIVAALTTAIFAALYWSQNLFQANDLNDFSEYYLRAQDWSRGNFSIGGGSDILLSVVEYIGIIMHPHDFLASYFAASKVLVILTLSGSLLFTLRNNDVLPSFWIKLATIIVTLSIPHFLFATITIDQTLLFAACLLFFLSTYNIPWAGFIAVLTFFSRPEAIIIIPLYGLLWYVDTANRKRILYNAGTFAVLLIATKVLFSSLTPPAVGGGSSTYQEYGFLSNLGWDYFKGLATHMANIPIIIFTYAYECLQNMPLFILFCIGFIFSVRQRTAWIMYGTLVFFLMAYAVLFATSDASPYSFYTSAIKRMSLEKDYFIINAFNKFDATLGHGRYRLVLYPAIVFFMIQGIAFVLGTALKFFSKNSLEERIRIGTVTAAAAIAVLYIGFRYQPIAKAHATDVKLESMHPVHKLGLSMRKSGNVGTVFLDNFCDPSQGSFLIEFASFSGADSVLTRFCDNSRIWTYDANNQRQVLDAPAYRTLMPSNNGLHAMFRRATAKQSELYDTTTVRKWQTIAATYDPSLMRSMNITHVIAARRITIPHLIVIDSSKGAFLHSRR